MSEVTYFLDEDFTKKVLNEPHKYLIFQISECTINALNDKCTFILKCQDVNWKPLLLEYHENVGVYTKYFYIEK